MVRDLILSALNRFFHWRGMELRALTPPQQDSSMAAGLKRAGIAFPEIATVIDIGAAAGKWTRLALPYFPQARFLMLEPLLERVELLETLRREHPRVEFASAAAGREPGEAHFLIAPDLDGSGVRAAPTGSTRTVPVTTLDREMEQRGLPAPYFVKLDTHGFEVPILEGAEHTLQQASLLMIEAYNFQISDPCLRFHELCTWLEVRGFRPIDLLEPMRRPNDGALWQMDLVFARMEHPAFSRRHYT